MNTPPRVAGGSRRGTLLLSFLLHFALLAGLMGVRGVAGPAPEPRPAVFSGSLEELREVAPQKPRADPFEPAEPRPAPRFTYRETVPEPLDDPYPEPEVPFVSAEIEIPRVQSVLARPRTREPAAAEPPPLPVVASVAAVVPAAPRGPTRPARPHPDNVLPRYPRRAAQQGIEGLTVLLVTVLVDGAPGEIRVEKSSGHALFDREAVATVRRWRFAPALRSGIPVTAKLRVPIRFQFR